MEGCAVVAQYETEVAKSRSCELSYPSRRSTHHPARRRRYRSSPSSSLWIVLQIPKNFDFLLTLYSGNFHSLTLSLSLTLIEINAGGLRRWVRR